MLPLLPEADSITRVDDLETKLGRIARRREQQVGRDPERVVVDDGENQVTVIVEPDLSADQLNVIRHWRLDRREHRDDRHAQNGGGANDKLQVVGDGNLRDRIPVQLHCDAIVTANEDRLFCAHRYTPLRANTGGVILARNNPECTNLDASLGQNGQCGREIALTQISIPKAPSVRAA